MKPVRVALLCLAAATAAAPLAATAAANLEENGEIFTRDERNGGVIILRINDSMLVRKDGDSSPTRYVVADPTRVRAVAVLLRSSGDRPLIYLEGLGIYVLVRAFGYNRLVGEEIASGLTVVVTATFPAFPR